VTRGTSLLDLIAALPDLLMAGFCLAVWIDPYRFGTDAVGYVVLVMLLEFIVVHSAAFMGSLAVGAVEVKPLQRWGRTTGILGLGVFYSLFVLGFCLAFHTWWPMAAFWLLTLNRLLGAIIGQGKTDEETKKLIAMGWGLGAACYLLGAFATTLLPVPRFGIERSLEGVGGGLWVDEPWRPVAFGVLYFGMIGWYELRWRKWTRSPAPVTPG
jgi:hypothetical protein